MRQCRFVLRDATDGIAISSPDDDVPTASGLDAPAPNPSRGTVRLSYTRAEDGAVRLAIYDVLGRQIDQRQATIHAGTFLLGYAEPRAFKR